MVYSCKARMANEETPQILKSHHIIKKRQILANHFMRRGAGYQRPN